MEGIAVKNLCVSYGKRSVLQDVSFSIPKGSLTCILGPNGAGKSSLLKAMVGLLPVTNGSVSFLSKSYASQRKKIAYVPQRNSVDWDFPVSVFDVVAMGCFGKRGLFRGLTKEDQQLICETCKKVDLHSLMHRQIRELSGGQQQKVFLARALVSQPEIYLMDEPFAGVDLATERVLIALLKQLQHEGKTIVLVHHDLHCVRQYFDFSVLLNHTLIDFGPVSQVFCQKNLQKTYGGIFSFLEKEFSHDV